MMFDTGDRIDKRYEVQERLGGGGMGVVLLVEDSALGIEVALKYCVETDEVALRRFKREVRAMRRVEHPHVMHVIDAELDYTPPYFTMPVATASLHEEVPKLKDDHVAATEALIEMCLGVEATHDAIGPHRDIKPLNALRMMDGRVVISDFGLAKIEPRDSTIVTRTADVLGTPAYMAPEQRNPGGSREASARTDVYQLGATAYHVLTGKLPVPVDRRELPRGVRHAVVKATEDLEDDRYSSVAEFRRELESFLANLRSPRPPDEVFEELLQALEQLHQDKKYNVRKYRQIVHTIGLMADDPEGLLDHFDKISGPIFKNLRRYLDPEISERLLGTLCDALDKKVKTRGYAYAETIAGLMDRYFYLRVESPQVSSLALRATLIAAVDLNRYKAMDEFDQMLLRLKNVDDEVADAASDMLRQEQARYTTLAARLDGSHLHPFIRAVRRDVLRAKRGST